MNNAIAIAVPRLATERLTLRAYRRADFALFAEHLMHPDSAAHLGQADRATAWRIFTAHAGLWVIDDAGWWAIEDKHSGQLVGNIGAFFREQSGVMELGWNTYRAYWGKGIASEAARAVLQYAFEVRAEAQVRALIAPDNTASRRVAERLGMRYEKDVELHGKVIGSYVRWRE
ncbi:conserved hypothetical protein [Ricinus communis]|uniref:N-acetyltransferase domain-containing protein n=1 Tax=Ricinus communis TaxID=3988 RepID=B9TEY6_RICCO|nr:conserved hypothetical protein [Ricinus communis]